MQKVHFYVVNAFSNKAFEGNPAGVVIVEEFLSDHVMQLIARQINHVETVFILKPTVTNADIQLRYFTPQEELPIAGHPTIASMFLWNKLHPFKKMTVQTKAGLVDVIYDQGSIYMSQIKPNLSEITLPLEQLSQALSVSVDAFLGSPKPIVSNMGLGHVVALIKDKKTLMSMKMNIDLLRQYCDGVGAREAQLIAYEEEKNNCLYHTRNFTPRPGDEDPACGNGNAAVAAWLAQENLLQVDQTISIAQGDIVSRPAVISITRHEDKNGQLQIAIGGQAVLMAEGTLYI